MYKQEQLRLKSLYLPYSGEGDNMANQAVCALNKITSGWTANKDLFDNKHNQVKRFNKNDLSSFAIWLEQNIGETKEILSKIDTCFNNINYEALLQELNNTILREPLLKAYAKTKCKGTVYDCKGTYKCKVKD